MNVLILHGYSDSNKGDLAIVVGMVNGIREARPGCAINLQSVYSEADPDFEFHHRFVKGMGVRVEQMAVPSPYVDTAGHSINRNIAAMRNLLSTIFAEWVVRRIPFSRRFFPKQAAALKTMGESDIVLLKGGQYIYNDQRGIRAVLYLWRILHPIYVASSMKRDVVMLGQSVGPLVDARGRNMVAEALSLCKLLVVRERKSEALLRDLELQTDVVLAPDLAFLIEPRRPTAAESVTSMLEEGGWLGVTVVNWSFPDHENPQEKRAAYLGALTEVAKRVHAGRGLRIALFPQVTVQHHGESDLDLLKVFASNLGKLGIPHLLVTDDLSPTELSYLYGCCETLLGTRLHSCILAACAFTPVVAIRYQGFKTEGIMAELGFEHCVFDIASMDIDGLTTAVLRSCDQRKQVSEEIRKAVLGFRAKLMDVLNKVLP